MSLLFLVCKIVVKMFFLNQSFYVKASVPSIPSINTIITRLPTYSSFSKNHSFLNFLKESELDIEKMYHKYETNELVLKCKSNKIHEIPSEIEYLSDLYYLSINDTEVKELPSEIYKCEKINTIVLINNKFEEFPYVIFNLPKLFFLIIEEPQITSIKIPDNCDVKKLKAIEIVKTPIKELVLKSTKILYLRLEDNELWNLSKNSLGNLLKDISEISSLKSLSINNNRLKYIPGTFVRLHLQTLDLSFNNITEIPQFLNHMITLKTLNLSNNNFVEFPKIFNFWSIKNLDLSYNYIYQKAFIHSSGNENLTLNLRHNSINTIMFIGDDLSKITLLLDDNCIQKVEHLSITQFQLLFRDILINNLSPGRDIELVETTKPHIEVGEDIRISIDIESFELFYENLFNHFRHGNNYIEIVKKDNSMIKIENVFKKISKIQCDRLTIKNLAPKKPSTATASYKEKTIALTTSTEKKKCSPTLANYHYKKKNRNRSKPKKESTLFGCLGLNTTSH